MSERPTYLIPLAGACLAALLLLLWLVRRDEGPPPVTASATPPTPPPAAAGSDPRGGAPSRALVRSLQALSQATGARPHEAILTFTSREAYLRFLARAARLGLTVLGRLDALLTVRVRGDDLAGLQHDVMEFPGDYADAGANYLVGIPQIPPKQDRAAQTLVPLGNGTLSFLGVTGDHRAWGRGITIAVLDSGVGADATFGSGQVQYLNIGLGTAPGTGAEDGHGTAVAALAAGSAPDAPGVAPAADLLSIRVTDAAGQSDVFTVAQGIVAAVDAGAQVINVSLGGYDSSPALVNAIAYAGQRGAVVVAAAGNDQAAQLAWPAADPSVISVGAVDALAQQVNFSNSGPQLKLTAPGYGVQTAWLDGQRVLLDGTSASAPLVAGAIAAVMSTNPGMSAAQAAQVLQQYASDGGAPGPDPDYGNGIVNLAWALNRNNPVYVDTAIASHYYDASTGQMEFVVQNRSGEGIGGLVLQVDASGAASSYALPLLGPGASYVVKQPVDPAQLRSAGHIVFTTELTNPQGVVDQVPANNRRISVLTPPGP